LAGIALGLLLTDVLLHWGGLARADEAPSRRSPASARPAGVAHRARSPHRPRVAATRAQPAA
jgi:hypothetical protein